MSGEGGSSKGGSPFSFCARSCYGKRVMNVTARRFVRITVALVALSATGACANTCSSNKEEEKKADVPPTGLSGRVERAGGKTILFADAGTK